ncbi:MAG: stage III sporulation protein AA [Eubacterium sp.]|nr:stage III sporulation protein AA [Eubacterium sp.]
MTEDEMINKYFEGEIREEILRNKPKGLNEIRLRAGQPVILRYGSEERVLSCKIIEEELERIAAKMAEYSVYAFKEEIKRGFITLKGGFRVGICGRAVISCGEVKGMRNISSLNIRVPCKTLGCSERVMKAYEKGFKNTVIVSPPGCGKTSLLRDLIRQLCKKGYNVGVCDERGEIGCFNDLGLRADVLEGFSKRDSLEILIRALNPDIAAADELGGKDDFSAVKEASYKGVGILATVHGDSVREYMKGFFDIAVILEGKKGKGEIKEICTLHC